MLGSAAADVLAAAVAAVVAVVAVAAVVAEERVLP
jgi:hypothetical protein